jgi:uncharacterized protein
MKPIFVDTGAWFALADRSDQYHERALEIFSGILPNHPLLTSNLVVSETHILIRRTIGHAAAIQFLEGINESRRIQKIYSTHILEEMAVEILKKFSDQDFSFTDAVSFAIMKQHGIRQAFAFDRHFATAGYSLIA